MKLSLCIATYNEEKFIHYPLDSAYELVDEVVIVDGGSTDKTVEIAKSYGNKVKIINADNPPMFHINKQKAIEAAQGEWILQLDADEAISKDLKSEIKSLISQSQSKSVKLVRTKTDSTDLTDLTDCNRFVAYYISRKNFFLSRFLTKGGVYPDYTIRLYRNGIARFPCKSVHENVEIISNNNDYESFRTLSLSKDEKSSEALTLDFSLSARNDKIDKIGFLKNPILHYADPNFSRYIKRWHCYNNLDVDLLIKNKTKVSFIDYCFSKPLFTFFNMYIRHKGFMDGIPGLIFAFFSSIRFWEIYHKWQKAKDQNNLK